MLFNLVFYAMVQSRSRKQYNDGNTINNHTKKAPIGFMGIENNKGCQPQNTKNSPYGMCYGI